MIETTQHYQAYASATQTVAKTKQIVLLYDGIIRFMQQAKEAIQEKKIEERYNILMKVSNVIFGLQSALDFEKGGEIAPILYNYYSSLDTRIFSVQSSNSIETCDDVIDDLKQMRDVWAEIDSDNDKGAFNDALAPESQVEDVPEIQAHNLSA